MSEFAYFQTIIQTRVPVNSDGSLGKPQMVKSWTTPMKDTKKAGKKRKNQVEVKGTVQEKVTL